MQCKECGSENFVSSDGWHYCKNCGRVANVTDYDFADDFYGILD